MYHNYLQVFIFLVITVSNMPDRGRSIVRLSLVWKLKNALVNFSLSSLTFN